MADGGSELGARLEGLGRKLGEREVEHRDSVTRAREFAHQLRSEVAAALERFHRAAAESGAPHLNIEVSEIRVDDKHLRAVEFDLLRGRHQAIVTVKARGDVTLVGPFHAGKAEGPCLTFPIEDDEDFRAALGSFLERFLEEAATP